MASPDRNTTAATSRATPNAVNDLYTKIDSYTTTEENARHKELINIFKLQDDIDHTKNNITNIINMGNQMFGTAGHNIIADEIKKRADELKIKEATLKNERDKKQKVIASNNRDFSDIKDKTNESKIIFLEDFTLLFLVMSYLFMASIAVYVITITSDNPANGFFKAILGAIVVTIIVSMVMYNIL